SPCSRLPLVPIILFLTHFPDLVLLSIAHLSSRPRAPHRRGKRRATASRVSSLSGSAPTYLTVLWPEAAIYLQCSQYAFFWYTTDVLHPTPPATAYGAARSTGPARRMVPCATSSPIVSSIRSSIPCPGPGG